MKTVYLVRHGKAESKGAGTLDFNRALMDDGKEISNVVAERLKATGFKPDVIISSPALRAYETACVFAKVFNYRIKLIRTRKNLYDSPDCVEFLEILQLLDDEYNNVMIFGHNPTISDFAMFLDLDFRESLPKSGFVGIEFNIDSWKNITGGKGKTVNYDSGKVNTENNKKCAESEIKKCLTDIIMKFLEKKDFSAAEKSKKIVEKSSCEISKKFTKETKNH